MGKFAKELNLKDIAVYFPVLISNSSTTMNKMYFKQSFLILKKFLFSSSCQGICTMCQLGFLFPVNANFRLLRAHRREGISLFQNLPSIPGRMPNVQKSTKFLGDLVGWLILFSFKCSI